MKRKNFILGLILSLLTALLLTCVYGAITKTGPFAEKKETPGFLEDSTSRPPETSSGPEPEEEVADPFPMYDRAKDETFTLDGHELLPAAIACEMDLHAPEEALKAQAVACYTLFCRKRANGEAIACDPEQWQVWTNEEHMRARWGQDYEGTIAALRSIVDQVYGEVILYEDEPILAAYTAISPGSTEDGALLWRRSYSYLRPVASPGDRFADGYLTVLSMTEKEFKEKLNQQSTVEGLKADGKAGAWLTDISYTQSGTVEHAVLCGVTVTGQELRAIFSLPAASFSVEHTDGGFTFTVRGRGHGVGLSQAGAVFFAKRGMGYEEILKHYYPGTELGALPKEEHPPETD